MFVLMPVILLGVAGIIAVIAVVIGRSGGNRLLMIGLIAALVLVLAVGGAILAVRGSQTRLLVEVSPGTSFVGRVTVDGVDHLIAGDETQTFTYSGKHIVFTIIPGDPSQPLKVEYAGRNVRTPYGAHGEIMRDSIWSAGVVFGGLDEDDWHRMAAELVPGHENLSIAPAADQESPGGS